MSDAPNPPGADPEPPAPAEAPRTAPHPGDRLLLIGFLVYVLLLALATYAQLADDRDLLSLFDLGGTFTR